MVMAGLAVLAGGGVLGGIYVAPMLNSPAVEIETEDDPIDSIVAAVTAAKAPEAVGGAVAQIDPSDLRFQFKNSFMVNLLDPSGRQYIQMGIQIEAATAEIRRLMEMNEAPLRDATIMLISGKTLEEVQSPAGVDRLKHELRARYEGVLGRPRGISEIYITDKLLLRQ